MANKNDALHLKKINSEVQPDNVNYATIRVDELGRVVYNDESGEKIVAYTEDASADLFVDERVLVGEYDEINEIGNRTEILDNKIIFREGSAPFTDRVIFSVDSNNTEIIKYEINDDIEEIVSVTKDLVVETLSGNNGEVVTLDANGKLVASGTTVADLSGGGSDSGLIDVQIFTSNGTWTKPAGCERVFVIVKGGGGGGGRSFGGGGEGQLTHDFITSGLGATETVTVGSGGSGVSYDGSGNASGGANGGTSSFGAHSSAAGGFVGRNTTNSGGSNGGSHGIGPRGGRGAFSTTTNGAAAADGSGAGGGACGSSVNNSGGNGGSGYVIVMSYRGVS